MASTVAHAADELPQMQGVILNGDVLSWSSFEGAAGYSVHFSNLYYGGNNIVLNTQTNIKELIESEGKPFPSGEFTIRLKAFMP